jgi:hypothetical protein
MKKEKTINKTDIFSQRRFLLDFMQWFCRKPILQDTYICDSIDYYLKIKHNKALELNEIINEYEEKKG